MIKGLQNSTRPFIKRVIIEDGFQGELNSAPQHNQYYESDVKDNNYSLNLTMDFCIKRHVDKITNSILNSLASFINSVSLQIEFMDSADELNKFLTLSSLEKIEYLNKFKNENNKFSNGTPISFSSSDFFQYLSISKDNISSKREISVPVTVTKKYNNNLSKENKNPNFLACVFFFTTNEEVISQQSIGAEILFSGNSAHKSTGYFIISDKFSFNGFEIPLTKVDLANSRRFLNPATGEHLNPNTETDRNQQVNFLYGAPGDIWAGPAHIHPITDRANINFGKGRIMAGESHSSGMPHPYLKHVTKENKKIIDLRDGLTLKDLFSYKSQINTNLSNMQRVVYTQEKNINLPIDQRINKAVFSDCKYSIRPISRQRGSENVYTKDNLILFFGLDKKELLAQTTKIPSLLRALSTIKRSLFSSMAASIDIIHFEIIRVEKRSGLSQVLLIGDNDSLFNDFNNINQLGKNISKGFSLINKTNNIYLEDQNINNEINLYEFTDGEIDAYHDNNEYSYKIKLKFRDPMIDYLSDKLNSLNRIIHDLDELLLKIGASIVDQATGKRVKVFNEYKKQLNVSFVEQSILSLPTSPMPLSFSFDPQSQLPLSVANAVSANNDMADYFSALNLFFNKNADSINTDSFIRFVKNSLMLSNTTPMLIEKNRSLFALLRDRTEKLLNTFTTSKMTKKSSGFTTKDFLKSTRSAASLSDSVITEYEYSFKKTIDLSKTKDHFDWIQEAQSDINVGLKTINNLSYNSLVENKNITSYLTDLGENSADVSGLFDYSFLPYSSPAVLDLHKTDKVNLQLNHLQTLRKNIIQNTSDLPESVLIPELLGTFGIKFLNSKSNLEAYITEQTNYAEGEIPVNNGFEDNFGSEYSSLFKNDKLGNASFGEIQNSRTAWAGSSYENYPSNSAMSLLNLITTNVFNRRDIEFLFNTRKNIPTEISLPYSTKLFSSEIMSNRETADTIITDIVGNLFDSNGLIKFEKYHYYSYLLNIFAKVYYLKGFGTRQTNIIDTADEDLFSELIYTNSSFVKDMRWEPLTAGVVNTIPVNRSILCKVVLFQDVEAGDMMDFNIIDIYKKYYNYNQVFLIKQAGTPAGATQIINPIQDESAPPIQIEINSYAAITRELLDKQVRNTRVLMQDENRMALKRDEKEEKVIKRSNSPHSVASSTYIKETRR